jgi:hypothetical protein
MRSFVSVNYTRFDGSDRDKKRKLFYMMMLQQQQAAAAAKKAEVVVPTITPEEETAILEATLPIPEPEPSFIRRNAVPLFIGGGTLVLGLLGMVLMIKV